MFSRTSAKKVLAGGEKITGWDFLDTQKLAQDVPEQCGVLILRYTE